MTVACGRDDAVTGRASAKRRHWREQPQPYVWWVAASGRRDRRRSRFSEIIGLGRMGGGEVSARRSCWAAWAMSSAAAEFHELRSTWRHPWHDHGPSESCPKLRTWSALS